jgi:glycerol-3-phosphate dehydrogenase
MVYDVLIIGGGVVGCAIAREFSRYKLSTILLEKEGDVAEGTSKANSGVIHAGFNVKTGSLKARLNVESLASFPSICDELDVPYKATRKLVVAKNRSELPYLEKLLEQGRRNGSTGLSIIAGNAIRDVEPLVRGEYALFSERTAVISPWEFTIALAENANTNGVEFRLYAEVVSIMREGKTFAVGTSDGKSYSASVVINSAGLRSDKVHSLLEKHDRVIHPCRGEYFVLDKVDDSFLRTAVYPVPPADGRGLGIHVTPTTEGNIILGPSAEFIQEPDDLATTKPVMKDLKREAIELIPELARVPVIKSYAGIRPKLFVAGGSTTFEDFIIEESEANPGFISLIGIESPGLTSAPAIAHYVVGELASRRLKLEPKAGFIPERRGFARISPNGGPSGKADDKSMALALEAAYASDPAYGEMICRCNHVSRAELLAALGNPLGAKTLNAIKKRTHMMMGRCQGGFCLPKILEILTEECGMAPEDIRQNADGSEVVHGYEI